MFAHESATMGCSQHRHASAEVLAARLGMASSSQVKQANLSQLEDVFLAVNDFEAAPREPGAHIPGVQPALLV